MPSGLIRVAKRTLSGEILQTIITPDFLSLVKSMVAVQGNYGDIVHTLDAIDQCGGCSASVALHPLPRTGRLYGQKTEIDAEPLETEESSQEQPSQEASEQESLADEETANQELDTTVGAIKSYSTSKTPWYRRVPFTKTSD